MTQRLSGFDQEMSPDITSSILDFVFRHWFMVGLCAIAAGFSGYFLSEKFKTPVYMYEARVMYNPNESGSPDYRPPRLHTLLPMLKSREVIQPVIDELQLEVDVSLIESSIDAMTPFESRVLIANMAWPDEQGQQVLGKTIESFIQKVRSTRRRAVESLHQQFKKRWQETELELAQARREQEEFYQRIGVIDLEADLKSLGSDVSLLTTALRRAETEQQSAEAKLALIGSGTFGRDTIAATSTQATAVADTRPQLDLKPPIDDAIISAARIDLEVMRAKLRESQELLKKELITPAEFRATEAEVKKLEATVSGKLVMGTAGMSPAQQVKLALEGAKVNVANTIEQLTDKQAAFNELRRHRQEGQALTDRLAGLITERNFMKKRMNDFTNLLQAGESEIEIIQPASPALIPVKSNGTKLLAGGFAGTLLALLIPYSLLVSALQRERPGNRISRQLNLPVIAQGLGRIRDTDQDEKQRNELRKLALRIRQACPKNGAVVLFSSLNRRASTCGVLVQVGKCLSLRDEKVALVEVRQAAGKTDLKLQQIVDESHQSEEDAVGFSDYLQGRNGQPQECVGREASLMQPSRFRGVDCLVAGQAELPVEALGNRRMAELLSKLRKHYTIILIAGPPADELVDLQIMADQADVVVACDSGRITPRAEASLRELVELKAPLLGIVS